MKNINMQPPVLKTLRKRYQTDKNFQGRTKIFNTIAEKFYARIKIFRETIFFLTADHMPSVFCSLSKPTLYQIPKYKIQFLIPFDRPQNLNLKVMLY